MGQSPIKLRLSPDLSLPIDALTETLAILGIRGSGKTNTATVLAEELLRQNQQVVIIDPVDSWWGIKSSSDGTKPGYPVVVLGGRHADLPLADKDGKTLADFVCDTRTSVVLSLRHFESKGQQQRFIVDFARRLYFRKGQVDNPSPLMLIIDEASLVVPQRVMGDEAQMVGAIQKLVRQGRTSGVGVTLIDQRAATVNKDVLTQLNLLVVHRTTSPHDRKALRDWVDAHDPEGKIDTQFLSSLAGLPQGTAWFWSSGWLDLFQKVGVRERTTFDSSRTPKAGERILTPTSLAAVDLDALKAKLSEAIEKAKADDPATLRARIRELEKAKPVAPAVDQATIDAAVKRAIDEINAEYSRVLSGISSAVASAEQMLHTVHEAPIHLRSEVLTKIAERTRGADLTMAARQLARVGSAARGAGRTALGTSLAEVRARANHADGITGVGSRSGGGAAAFTTEFKLRKGERKMLEVLARRHPVAAGESDIALLAGLTRSGGTFSTYIGILRKHGLIEDTSAGIYITADGREAIGVTDALPPQSNADVWNMWMGAMRAGERRMMEVLRNHYPTPIARSQLSAESEIAESGGTFSTYIGVLKRNGVATESGEGIALNPTLFPEDV